MKVSKVNEHICLVQATDQATLGNTFLRFQEHYESPEWKGKIFTVGQFKAWYSNTYGQNSYERDWTGFNIPSYVLEPFIKGLFDPLTPLEQEFLNLFKYRTDKFYIIGAQDNDSSTLQHEICHALYYTNDSYRIAVEKLLKLYKRQLGPVYDHIARMMYHKSVWNDEVHAYVSADAEYLSSEGVAAPLALSQKLQALRHKYIKG